MAVFNFETTGEEVASKFKDQIKGKNVLITGVSPDGLGAAAAAAIAAHNPGLIVLAGRSLSKVELTKAALKAQFPAVNTRVLELDLASLAAVRKAAEEVNSYAEVLDVVINNAGIMAVPFAKTVDGIESQFGANHIGHFLFTNLILPRILSGGSTSPRIVNLSSDAYGMARIRYDDINWEKAEYQKWPAYGGSKSANILFSAGLAHRFGSKGLLSFSVHPGVITTQLMRDLTPEEWKQTATAAKLRFKTISQGTAGHLIAAFDPTISEFNGGYFADGNITKLREAASWVHGQAEADKLWAFSEELVGQKFP